MCIFIPENPIDFALNFSAYVIKDFYLKINSNDRDKASFSVVVAHINSSLCYGLLSS